VTGEYVLGQLTSAADPLVGRVLSDRYRILKKLGEGGAGGVYLAEHLELRRTVALKVLLPEYTGGPRAIEEFLNEARTVQRLGHENIIDISYGGQSADGLAFLAMEFLEGEDLGQLLRRQGALSWERARPILLQVASALSAVHKEGIVHSDIKPDNIFLARDGGRNEFVKVLDFGVAKAVGTSERASRSVSGTPQYMSPEQTLGQTLDARSDVYSLGCVMYQALTGTLPFQAESVIDLMAKHNYERPVPPRQRRPDLAIAPGVERIILQTMEKDPAQRFQSMDELSAAIARLRIIAADGAERAHQLRIDDPHLRGRRRLRHVRAALVLVAGVAAFSFVAYEMTRERPPARVGLAVQPSAARIFLDGKPVGEGPLVLLRLRPGRHRVWAETPGYLRAERELEVGEGEHVELALTLPLSPATGFEIRSEPSDLPVWLDGVPLPRAESSEQARTDYIARRIRPGLHRVEVRSADAVWTDWVLVEPDVIAPVHAKLAPEKVAPPRPTKRRPESPK
jgi:hypothetical protein